MTSESLYLGALESALEGNLQQAQDLYEQAEAQKAEEGLSFSESVSGEFPYMEEALHTLLNSYDFARCMRPDGSFYGTRGKCKKGSEAGPAPQRKGVGQKAGDEAAAAARAKGKRGKQIVKARVAAKKAALEASKKAGGEKQSRNNARTRIMKELMSDPKRQAKFKKLAVSGDTESLEKFWGDLAIEAEGRLAKRGK